MEYLETELSFFNPEPRRNAFIQGPLPWIIIIAYLMYVKVIGPRTMKNRKPFDPKMLMLAYNFAMVVLNVGLYYTALPCFLEWWPHRCDIKKSPAYTNRQKYYFLVWYLVFVKFAELIDTVFFVVRKKFNQVSFLHVFHHSVMCILVTLSLKYDFYSFYHVLVCCVNSVIHVLLYSYYGLSAVRPDLIIKYFWCKKYLTRLQIVQFFLYMVYMLHSNFIGCGYGFRSFDIVGYFFIVALTALFFNFYSETYKANGK